MTDGDGTSTLSPTLDQLRSLLSWYGAQRARISDPDRETITRAGESATVRCQWQLHDAVIDAVGRGGDTVETEWTIVAGRVVGFERTINWSVQLHASFNEWVSTNHPDDYAAVSTFPFELSSAEEAATGELFAEHAPDWADYFFNGPAVEPVDE